MPNIRDYDVVCYSGTKRKQSELLAVFDKISPKGNWKEPICAILHKEDKPNLGLVHAIVHFTGSIATFEEGPVIVLVTAPGYYTAVGA